MKPHSVPPRPPFECSNTPALPVTLSGSWAAILELNRAFDDSHPVGLDGFQRPVD